MAVSESVIKTLAYLAGRGEYEPEWDDVMAADCAAALVALTTVQRCAHQWVAIIPSPRTTLAWCPSCGEMRQYDLL